MLISVLVTLIIVCVIVGLLLYLVDLLPIDGTIKLICRIAAILVVIVWLLSVLVGQNTYLIRL